MTLTKRLHLDDVVTSFPELGPTVPDSGYSWVVLLGVFLVQMTISSVVAMYGVVLEHMSDSKFYLDDVWDQIILTPILFTAFWNLADPWTRVIVNIAPIPRLVGIIGVLLLTFGLIASGYLAINVSHSCLKSSSAGAVMGIGASLVALLSDHVLRKYFRKKLLIALTVKNVGVSWGLIFIPSISKLLLQQNQFISGVLVIIIVVVPSALGTLTFRLSSRQRTSPYSLLLSTDEDTELPIKISSDDPKDTQRPEGQNYSENFEYIESEEQVHGGGLFSEGSNIYSYEEPDEDDLFVNPLVHSYSKWKHQLRPLKTFRFWAAIVGWVGIKVFPLFFWLFLPVISFRIVKNSYYYMLVLIIAGVATVLPNLASYKVLKMTSHNRRVYFGLASWICGIVSVGLTCATNYMWIVICALLGGFGIGSLSSCQDLPLYDVFGTETMRFIHKGFSTIVGLCILSFCFTYNINYCLNITALLLYFGGAYWILSSVVNSIKARRHRFPPTISGTNRDKT